MTNFSLNTIGAAQALAECIEGFAYADGIALTHGDLRTAPLRGDRLYTELRLLDPAGKDASAIVTIERGRRAYGDQSPASVTFSSSSSTAGTGYARATAALLTFAADVADLLNQWAAAGQLPRLGGARREPGVWTYVFPDAVEDGRSKTVTINRPEPLEDREVEDLMARYGATSCQGTPPAVPS